MGILLKDQKVLYASENIGKINIDVAPTQPARVDITPSSGTLAATAGATLQLTATVLPATASDKTVTWSTSNSAVATVDSTGLVTRTAPLTSSSGQPSSVTIYATTSNGVSGIITLTVAMIASLPAGAFAVFDGMVQPNNGEWADQSGNRHKAFMGGAADYEGTVWDTDHLVCAVDNCVSGLIYNGGFTPTNGMTFNACIEYDASASGYNNPDGAANNLDILFAVGSSDNSDKMQMGIGKRGTDNANKIFAGVNDGSWHIEYTDNQFTTTGKHLLTWVVNGENVAIYVDGASFATFNLYAAKSDDHDDIGILAATSISDLRSRIYNFFGNVYGLSIYNKALSSSEVTQVKNYYKTRFSMEIQ